MKTIAALIIATLITACAPTREYTVQEDPEMVHSFAGMTVESMIDGFNAQMHCDIWKVTPNRPLIHWVESLGDASGIANTASGEIRLSKEALGPRSNLVAQLVLLHELGHNLGYKHTNECGVMNPDPSPCAPYADQIQDFLKQIEQDQICLNEIQ